jgi:hypothetical protein
MAVLWLRFLTEINEETKEGACRALVKSLNLTDKEIAEL